MCEFLSQHLNTPIILAAALSRPAIVWGIFALLFTCVLISYLKTGTIWTPEGVSYTRERDHFHYNAWVFWAALLATIFLGAALAYFYYPNAGKPIIRDELPAELHD